MSRALLAALVLVVGCQRHAGEPEPEARPALTVVVGDAGARELGYVGTLEGRYTSQLAFRVGGRVRRRLVSVGDHVRRGQELAALDSTSLALAATAAAADLAGATASRESAGLTLERQNTLLATGATVQANVDDARAVREVAGANVDQAAARLDKARQELSYGILRADFEGIITRIDFEVEQVVAPDAPIGEIVQPNAIDFVFDVPERVARQLVVGTPFDVKAAEPGAVAMAATVREIGPAADRATRTRRIRLSVDARPEVPRLGTTLYATQAGEPHLGVRVPAAAVLDAPDAPAVWVVDHDLVQRRAVVLGPKDEDDFVVQSGVGVGERIVIAGVHSIRDGQRVKVSEAP